MNTELIKFENLTKGYIIPAEEVELIVGVSRENAKYALRVMGLCSTIEKYFAIERSESVSVVQKDYNVVILSDEDAHYYHSAKFLIDLQKMERDVEKMKRIDVNNLPETMIDKHNRMINVMGATYTAAKSAFKQANAKYFPIHKSNKPEQLGIK